MHLIQAYSLASSSKIGKPFILKKFFPLAVDKYITVQSSSKYNSKCYDWMQDVVDDLRPILDKEGITIIQIGAKDDKPLKGCYLTCGQTNLGQAAYIIDGALLHLGVDSFAAHIASGFNKKIVCLYSNNYVSCVRPYWTKDEDCVLLEPDRKGNKPNFSVNEIPKTINEIKPEDIVASVCKLLGLKNGNDKKTVYFGNAYTNKFIEMVPNQIIDPSQFGLDSIIVRMDFEFNELNLAEQLKRSKVTIVTDRPISNNVLRNFRSNIKDVVFTSNKLGNLEFVKNLTNLNISTFLISNLQGKELDLLKLEYLDYGIVNCKPKFSDDVALFKNVNKKFYYKSSKITLSNGQFFPSYAALLSNKPINSFDCPVQEIIDTDDFWKELEHFKILT